jgi:hypothetical protein
MYAPFDLRFAAIIITRKQITLVGPTKDESIQRQVNASLLTGEGTNRLNLTHWYDHYTISLIYLTRSLDAQAMTGLASQERRK